MTVSRDVSAPRQCVWDVVADGWTYSQWVVGNSRMRAVDRGWPAEGTRIKHSLGVWPLVIDDDTVSVTCAPGEELVFLAQMGPVGAALVTLRLTDVSGGCRLEMSEEPAKGLVKALPHRLVEAALDVRNRECLWRLEQLAEAREPGEIEGDSPQPRG